MSTDEANDFLFGGGAPSATFPTVGTEHKGRIVAMVKTQQRDFATKQPKVWDNGDPMMQVVITLQTEQRDQNIDDDDGTRRLYIDSPNKRRACQAAAKKAGVTKFAIGGMLAMKYAGDDPDSKNPANPAKLYSAFYKAPEPGQEEPPPAAHDDYGEEPF